jgi:hypothetical protein
MLVLTIERVSLQLIYGGCLKLNSQSRTVGNYMQKKFGTRLFSVSISYYNVFHTTVPAVVE